MKNFHKVRTNLYRGSAPEPADVCKLFEKLDIKRIISLDKESGQEIEDVCGMFNIEHIIIPLDPANTNSLKCLLKQDIRQLIDDQVPTFIHCAHGKDRSGLFIALVRCLLDGWDCQKALKEAKQLGFGTGLNFKTEKLYTKLICKACEHDHQEQDNNHAYDILQNLTDLNAQYRDYQLDPYQGSWAPYADNSKNLYPSGTVDPYYEGENTTRNNHGLNDITDMETNNPITKIPMVGAYDQLTQTTNLVGPSVISGGFI